MYIEDSKFGANIAHNVTLEFEATSKVRRTKAEAKKEVELVIPKDAVKVKGYTVDEGRDVVQYESELLAERLQGLYSASLIYSDDTKPGTFIVIYKYDDRGIFAVVIGSGDNP